MSKLSQAITPLKPVLGEAAYSATQILLQELATAAQKFAATMPATPANAAEAAGLNIAAGLANSLGPAIVEAELASAGWGPTAPALTAATAVQGQS